MSHEPSMPLFYFDIRDGKELPDRHGLQFENLEDAQAYALQMAMTFLSQNHALFWEEHDWSIDIREGSGATLYRLSFQLSQPLRHGDTPDGSIS